MENIFQELVNELVDANELAIKKIQKIHKNMTIENDFSGDFCVYCGDKKSIDRILNTKNGAIIVSLCTKCMGRTNEEICEVISDSL